MITITQAVMDMEPSSDDHHRKRRAADRGE
jgi:hypothetical protein